MSTPTPPEETFQSRWSVLFAGIRRFLVILVSLAAGTALIGLVASFLGNFAVDRAVSAAFDLVGVFLLVVGFFVGNRGPVRLKGAASVPLFAQRQVRWATPDERTETLNDSAIFVAVGIVMILIGIAIDSRYSFI